MNENKRTELQNLINQYRWQKQWQTLQSAIDHLADQKTSSIQSLYEPLIDDGKIQTLIAGCYSCLKVEGSNYIPETAVPPQAEQIEEMMALIQIINAEHHIRAAKHHERAVSALSVFANAVIEYYLFSYFDIEPKNMESLAQLHEDFSTFLMPSPNLDDPKDFVIGFLLKQISIDVLSLQQTLYLRETKQNGMNQLSRQLAHTMAEVLARRALLPAMTAKFLKRNIDEFAILSYPTDAVSIRTVPYLNDLMIGFPITAFCNFEKPQPGEQNVIGVTVSTAYLTLAHEVGHFVYRYGCPNSEESSQTFENLLSQETGIYQEWVVELFCDVYSCMVEGPIAAVGFQELLEQENLSNEINPTSLFLDEIGKIDVAENVSSLKKVSLLELHSQTHHGHAHPPSLLRPFIFAQILRLIAKQLLENNDEGWVKEGWNIKEMSNKLDERWQNWLENDRVSPISLESFKFSQEAIDKLLAFISPTLEKIIELLLNSNMQVYQPDPAFMNQFSKPVGESLDITLYNLYNLTCAKVFLESYHHKTEVHANDLEWFKEQFEARKEEWSSRRVEGFDVSFVRDGGLRSWLTNDAWSDDGPTGGSSGREPNSS